MLITHARLLFFCRKRIRCLCSRLLLLSGGCHDVCHKGVGVSEAFETEVATAAGVSFFDHIGKCLNLRVEALRYNLIVAQSRHKPVSTI